MANLKPRPTFTNAGFTLGNAINERVVCLLAPLLDANLRKNGRNALCD